MFECSPTMRGRTCCLRAFCLRVFSAMKGGIMFERSPHDAGKDMFV